MLMSGVVFVVTSPMSSAQVWSVKVVNGKECSSSSSVAGGGVDGEVFTGTEDARCILGVIVVTNLAPGNGVMCGVSLCASGTPSVAMPGETTLLPLKVSS